MSQSVQKTRPEMWFNGELELFYGKSTIFHRKRNVNLNMELQNNIVFMPTIFTRLSLKKPALVNSSRNVIREV